MAYNHMKRCSALVIKEMQIKTIMRCHYAPIRVKKLKRLTILSVDKDVQNSNSYTSSKKSKIAALWNTIC